MQPFKILLSAGASPPVYNIIKHLKFLGHYVHALDPLSSVGLKPDGASFDSLCKRHKSGKTIMVGDRFDIDGLFAQNAGIDFIGVGFHGN